MAEQAAVSGSRRKSASSGAWSLRAALRRRGRRSSGNKDFASSRYWHQCADALELGWNERPVDCGKALDAAVADESVDLIHSEWRYDAQLRCAVAAAGAGHSGGPSLAAFTFDAFGARLGAYRSCSGAGDKGHLLACGDQRAADCVIASLQSAGSPAAAALQRAPVVWLHADALPVVEGRRAPVDCERFIQAARRYDAAMPLSFGFHGGGPHVYVSDMVDSVQRLSILVANERRCGETLAHVPLDWLAHERVLAAVAHMHAAAADRLTVVVRRAGGGDTARPPNEQRALCSLAALRQLVPPATGALYMLPRRLRLALANM